MRSVAPPTLDVMIALHACDIATDYAIHTGMRAGASIIMCSPCCHKQIRPQMQSPHPLQPMLQHGLHLGQQAEMVTDGLRALLLEACGYETQVFEFVSLDHTNKNKMILAVKRARATRPTRSGADRGRQGLLRHPRPVPRDAAEGGPGGAGRVSRGAVRRRVRRVRRSGPCRRSCRRAPGRSA